MEKLLRFMYTGNVGIPESELNSLLKTAEALMIKGICPPDHVDDPSKQANVTVTSENASDKDNNRIQVYTGLGKLATA